MAKKDITTKAILKHIVQDIAHYIFHLDLDSAELLDTESQRVEKRQADLVIQATQGQRDFILHIEIQNNNQAIMPLRMLRYYTDIALGFPKVKEIEQYLIYIGKDKLTMADGITNKHQQYHYHLIDMRTIDCAIFLNDNNPHAVVLAVLCDFKGRDKRTVIRQLLQQIDRLTVNNGEQYNECILALEILSENRELTDIVKEEEQMLSEIKLENLPSYEIGLERGELRGERIGEVRGEARGELRGKEIGKEIGEEIGKKIGETKIIQNMLGTYTDEQIHEITGVDIKTIQKIRAETH